MYKKLLRSVAVIALSTAAAVGGLSLADSDWGSSPADGSGAVSIGNDSGWGPTPGENILADSGWGPGPGKDAADAAGKSSGA